MAFFEIVKEPGNCCRLANVLQCLLAVVFLKFLHLISDGHIRMALREVANDRLSVLEGQVQRFERGDIQTASRTVDPNCSMMVDKQVAVEVFEFQLVVWV